MRALVTDVYFAIPPTRHIRGDWMSADGRVLYFSSSRPGGAGDRDLYRATRPATGGAFSDLTPIDELNTSQSDTDPWLSPDERTMFFSRGAGTGADIYVATR